MFKSYNQQAIAIFDILLKSEIINSMNIEQRIATTHKAVEVLITGLDEAIDIENKELRENFQSIYKSIEKLEPFEIWKPRGKYASKIWLGEIIRFVLTAIAFFVQQAKIGTPASVSLTNPTWKNLVTDIESFYTLTSVDSKASFYAFTYGILARRKISDAITKRLIDILTDKNFLVDFKPEHLGYCYEPLLEYQLETVDNKMQVVNGSGDRRSTGSHYTPIDNAYEIVKDTINPLIFKGCRDGKPEKDWELISSKEMLDLKVCDPSVGGGIFLLQTCRYMASFLVRAWEQEHQHQDLPFSDKMLLAKQTILRHCLYGVDISRMAVEVAKLTLKLETQIDSFVLLDQHIKCGDALVGANAKQVAAKSLKVSSEQLSLYTDSVKQILDQMAIAREKVFSGEWNEIPKELYNQWLALKTDANTLIEAELKK